MDVPLAIAMAVPILAVGAFSEVLSNVNKISSYSKTERYRRNNGELGELEVKIKLEKLPDEYAIIKKYYIFHNIFLKEDADYIVIGPNGIFNIEVKAHWARVSYSDSHHDIEINKKIPTRSFMAQINRQKKDICQHLEASSISFPPSEIVQNIIVFTNALSINLEKDNYLGNYIIGSERLLDIIQRHQTHHLLNERQIKELTSLFSSKSKEIVRGAFARSDSQKSSVMISKLPS